MEKYQVYRITPVINKYYVTAEYTRRIGRWPEHDYYTNIKPRYVGKFINEISSGFGDGKQTTYYFYNDVTNSVNKVFLSYEGTTCFEEVDSIQMVNKRKRILSLSKMMISNSEPCIHLEDQQNILSIVNEHLNDINEDTKKLRY